MSASPEFELWLVRHARPLIDEGVCYGRLDIPADEDHTQSSASALVQALRAQAPNASWTLRVSPLQRATALAHAISTQLACDTLLDERLAEMDFGDWEGRRWDQMAPAAFDSWTADFTHHRVGGGESVADFMQRVRAAWLDTWQQARTVRHTRTLWVTHAGVIRAMQLLHQGIHCPTRASDWPRQAPGFGAWVVLRWPFAHPL